MDGNKLSMSLSKTAKKGRFGDTELVHVNEQEKDILESLGGSGTINPETGLKEYWLLQAAGLALGAYGAWKHGSMTRTAGEGESSELGSMMGNISSSITNLADVYSSKKDLLLAEVGNTYRKLGGKYIDAKTKFKRQSSENIGRSDLVASTSTQRQTQTEEDVRDQYRFDVEDITGTLDIELGNLSSWYEGELAQLDLQQKQTESRLNLAKRGSKSWYLGKGIEDTLT